MLLPSRHLAGIPPSLGTGLPYTLAKQVLKVLKKMSSNDNMSNTMETEEPSSGNDRSPPRKSRKPESPNGETSAPGSGALQGPASYNGPPVMMNLVNQAGSFKSLTRPEQKKMVEEIRKMVGQIQDVFLAERGDLVIVPLTTLQKRQLLEITSLDDSEVKCSLTKWEQECKALIHGVPVDLTDDEIKTQLKNDGVVGVKRMNRWKDGKSSPTESVILNFSARQLPSRVKIDWLSFQVKTFIPPPKQCWNCWGFGHTKMTCIAPPRCRKCSDEHASDIRCKKPAQCPNCLDAEQTGPRDHEAGTIKCPLFASRRESNRTATLQSLSFEEAKRRNGLGPGGTSSDHDLVREMSTMKRDIEELKKKEKSLESLVNHPVIAKIQGEVADLRTEVQEVKEKVDLLAEFKEEMKEEVREEVKKATNDMKNEAKKDRASFKREAETRADAHFKKIEALLEKSQQTGPKTRLSGTNKISKVTVSSPSHSMNSREDVLIPSGPSSCPGIATQYEPPRVDSRCRKKKSHPPHHDPVN